MKSVCIQDSFVSFKSLPSNSAKTLSETVRFFSPDAWNTWLMKVELHLSTGTQGHTLVPACSTVTATVQYHDEVCLTEPHTPYFYTCGVLCHQSHKEGTLPQKNPKLRKPQWVGPAVQPATVRARTQHRGLLTLSGFHVRNSRIWILTLSKSHVLLCHGLGVCKRKGKLGFDIFSWRNCLKVCAEWWRSVFLFKFLLLLLTSKGK